MLLSVCSWKLISTTCDASVLGEDMKCICIVIFPKHDDVIKWKHFPRYWPFVRGIHRSPVNSPHKGQWRGALMFSLICVCINDWVNNREAGDLRRYGAHYDITVMNKFNNTMVKPDPWLLRKNHKLTCHWITFRVKTHWDRDEMDAISQTTFWSAFSWMKMFEFRLKFHWSLFLRVQLTIFQHWFR